MGVPSQGLALFPLLATGSLVAGCSTATPAAAAKAQSVYEVRHRMRLDPGSGTAQVTIEVEQSSGQLKRLDLDFGNPQLTFVSADGKTTRQGDRVVWELNRSGGTLALEARIDRKRDNGLYDARLTDQWALFRGDRVFPSARAVTRPGAQSKSSLRIDAPKGWSAITPYGSGMGEWLPVDNPERNYDRPTGWMVAGKLGVRVTYVGDTKLVVAGPDDQGVRRVDMLALLRWTLPQIVDVFGPLGPRLVIVSAGDPMWRGGLSGPASFYIHSDRPLISENGTSSLLHEVIHTLPGMTQARDADWLVEGLAEFYSVEALYRSGTVGKERYEGTRKMLREWGSKVKRLRTRSSTGAHTARAATLLWELDAEVAAKSGGRHSLDDVVRVMREQHGELSAESLLAAARQVAEDPLKGFSRTLNRLLPG